MNDFQKPTPPFGAPSDKMLDERLANIFITAGIPLHVKGYRFLREAVKLAIRNPNVINNITKQLYPAVAAMFDTSPSKVERAIRHAIEVAWARGKIENINSVYGIKIFGKGDKPTNGELIALISDKLIIEFSF
jgi:two-component system response regulator (stage 0 sporulation protein A)